MLDDKSNEIIYFYTAENKSISCIAKHYNCNPSVIRRILVKNSIEIRDNNFYKSKSCDEKYFDVIDSEYKAYILGFIYADGYITNNTFGIKLSIKDIELLNIIKNAIKSEHKIIVGTNNSGFGIGKQYCLLSINNKHMVNSLKELGVVYNKSKILTFPTSQQVPENLIHHFIRGYFDGDGSVYKSRTSSSCSMIGTHGFLSEVLLRMRQVVGTESNVYKYKDKEIYEIKIGGNKQLRKIYDYFYNEANIFLGRKKNRFEEILNI